MTKQKIKILLPWIILPIILIGCLAFNSVKRGELVCESLNIEVEPVQGVYFLTKKDIETKIFSQHESLVGSPIESIDLAAIERSVQELAHVKKVKVYAGIAGDLFVKISQRNPVVRFLYPDGTGFYIDDKGEMLPLSKNYTARVLVVNGNLKRSWLKLKSLESAPLLTSIYNLALEIRKDAFLNAQLQQLYVNENQEFEFVPRVGNHIIEFGDDSQKERKLENLKIFYLEGLAYKGWNRYSKVSLKFKDQVVCTKK